MVTRQEYIRHYIKHYKKNGKIGAGMGIGTKPQLLKDCGYTKGTVLDYGCGWGVVSQCFNESYLGVDIVPQAIEIAKKEFPEKKFRVLEIGKLKTSARDFVFAFSVFTHARKSDVPDCLSDIHRNLKKSGIAALDILEGEDKQDIHFRYWNKQDFIKELEKAGFEIKETFVRKWNNNFTHTYFILRKA